jgi:signal transduction histidine kinase
MVTEEVAATVPKLKSGSYACVSITDNGKGMDEETWKRIFEPFYTTKFQGRGLGMAAAYGIIKNHNGAIAVDSELGKGTEVRIYLPASEMQMQKSGETKPLV